MKKIILIGSGGHASSVIESMDNAKFKFVGYIDKFKEINISKKIISNDIDEKVVEDFSDCYFFVAIGDNKIRDSWFKKIQKYKLKTVNIIDETAIIGKSVNIGTGNYIGKNVTITADVYIGNNNIINTGSIIDHGTKVSDSCNISPGAILNGDVIVNDLAWICSGCIIFGQKKIGRNSICGAGSIINKDVDDNWVVVGNPMKFLKTNN